MKKLKKVDEALKATLAGIEIAQSRVDAFNYSLRGLLEYQRTPISGQIGVIHAALYENLHKEYQRLFMWGCLDPAAQAEAKKIALKKFLSDNHSIMQFLDPEGRFPGRWQKSEEDKFRAEIKSLSKRAK